MYTDYKGSFLRVLKLALDLSQSLCSFIMQVICSHSLYLLFKIHVEGTDNKKMNPLTYLMREHPPSQRHRASPLLLF